MLPVHPFVRPSHFWDCPRILENPLIRPPSFLVGEHNLGLPKLDLHLLMSYWISFLPGVWSSNLRHNGIDLNPRGRVAIPTLDCIFHAFGNNLHNKQHSLIDNCFESLINPWTTSCSVCKQQCGLLFYSNRHDTIRYSLFIKISRSLTRDRKEQEHATAIKSRITL